MYNYDQMIERKDNDVLCSINKDTPLVLVDNYTPINYNYAEPNVRLRFGYHFRTICSSAGIPLVSILYLNRAISFHFNWSELDYLTEHW